jgi:hypothetical protein
MSVFTDGFLCKIKEVSDLCKAGKIKKYFF